MSDLNRGRNPKYRPLRESEVVAACRQTQRTGSDIVFHGRYVNRINLDMRVLGKRLVNVDLSDCDLSDSNLLFGKTGVASLRMVNTLLDGTLLHFEGWRKGSPRLRQPDGSVLWDGVTMNLTGATYNEATVFPEAWVEGTRPGQSPRSRAEEVASALFGVKKSGIPRYLPPSNYRRPPLPENVSTKTPHEIGGRKPQ